MKVAELWRYPVKGLRGERGIVTGRRKRRMIGAPATLDGNGEALIDGHAAMAQRRL